MRTKSSEVIQQERMREILEYSWLELGDTTQIETVNPLIPRTVEDQENFEKFILRLLIRPDYFPLLCRHVFNVELLPLQAMAQDVLWNHRFCLYLATRGGAKTFMIALYIMRKLLLDQGIRIVMTGAGLRQSKGIFEYCENIWYNAPILRDIVGTSGKNGRKNGPRRDVDRLEMIIGDSIAVAIPLGDGSTVRGLRANVVIADEFQSINREVFEVVVEPFGAVSRAPVENVKKASMIRTLKELGIEIDDSQEYSANQTILAGTADYTFNHIYDYYKKYTAIVESKGDESKLAKLFDGVVPPTLNYKDYAVLRLPVELMPSKFMDEVHIAKSRMTMVRSSYDMEYGVCVGPQTNIVTDQGLKAICDINIGDMVYTHMGRFKKVIKVLTRNYNGNILKIDAMGSTNFLITPEHPVWQKDNFINAENLKEDNYLLFPKYNNLNNKRDIKISDYCDNYSLYHFNNLEYIYPNSSNLKHGQNKYKNKLHKGCILNDITLDYNFGLIIGYYAAEGSCGQKQVSFSLDGHHDIALVEMIKELKLAIKKVFNKEAKEYIKKNNVVDVTINSRILRDFFRKICPGVANSKYVLEDVLFSNVDFIKGFIRGYWRGDGCIYRENNKYASTASTISNKLSVQTKLCLSILDIPSSNYIRPSRQTKIHGRVCDCSQTYTTRITGDNARLLDSIVNDNVLELKDNRKIYFDDGVIYYPINSIELLPYNGKVYNLEVEEDNTYCLYNGCVHNCFPEDSFGFFKRTLIEGCTTKEPINIGDMQVKFSAMVVGNPKAKYVYGVDPASGGQVSADNFSITITECYPNHRRVVYCWTYTRQLHKEKIKKGYVQDKDFYRACVRKIRDLMEVFPCEAIAMDTQGGGFAILEALQDTTGFKDGSLPILEIIDEDKEKDSDMLHGLHIVHMVNFANNNWVVEANNNLRMDMESKTLLFPYIDSISLAYAIEEDETNERENDTLEDCVFNIEEMKDELTTIVHTRTANGTDRWDVPDIKLPGNKKGKMRKDRYSSLLLANQIARNLNKTLPMPEYRTGRLLQSVVKRTEDIKPSQMYSGPAWFEEAMQNYQDYGVIVRRN